MARALPSTLHQKKKFVIEGQLICVVVEENMIVTTSLEASYIEVDEKVLECSF